MLILVLICIFCLLCYGKNLENRHVSVIDSKHFASNWWAHKLNNQFQNMHHQEFEAIEVFDLDQYNETIV